MIFDTDSVPFIILIFVSLRENTVRWIFFTLKAAWKINKSNRLYDFEMYTLIQIDKALLAAWKPLASVPLLLLLFTSIHILHIPDHLYCYENESPFCKCSFQCTIRHRFRTKNSIDIWWYTYGMLSVNPRKWKRMSVSKAQYCSLLICFFFSFGKHYLLGNIKFCSFQIIASRCASSNHIYLHTFLSKT